MELERKCDLSVAYFLKDLFATNPEISIVDGFPEQLLTLPTVAVDLQTVYPIPGELGDKKGVRNFVFFIDIFAKNKAQRDELGFKIYHALEDSVPVYNYEEGFPPSVAPTQESCLVPDNLRMEIIRIMPDLVDTLYYRATVIYEAHYNQL